MTNETNNFIGGLLIGYLVGMMFIIIVTVYTDATNFIPKIRLENKQTITMDKCYAQYSAVRRFPK